MEELADLDAPEPEPPEHKLPAGTGTGFTYYMPQPVFTCCIVPSHVLTSSCARKWSNRVGGRGKYCGAALRGHRHAAGSCTTWNCGRLVKPYCLPVRAVECTEVLAPVAVCCYPFGGLVQGQEQVWVLLRMAAAVVSWVVAQ
jgi:hypothetical protein